MVLQPLEGYQVERAGTHAVALNLELDDELLREGLAREVVHAIQNARKAAGLNVEDRISLTLGGDDGLLDAVRAHEPYVTGETLATSLVLRRRERRARGRDRGGERALEHRRHARVKGVICRPSKGARTCRRSFVRRSSRSPSW